MILDRFFENCRKLFFLICVVTAVLLFPVIGYAAEEEAEEISSSALVSDSHGFANHTYLFDNNRREGYSTGQNASLTLSYQRGIGSLYLTFFESYGPYSVINLDTGEKITIDNGYLHAFVDLVDLFGTAPKRVKLSLENGPATLYEMKVFTAGEVPDSIQKWSDPMDGKTDLVLFSAHSDDDQLFFAGLLPYYGVERGYQVQVVYLTDHSNTYKFRAHELLDGLWAVGIRSYPVMASYPDFYKANTLEGAFAIYQSYGYDREELTGFVVELLRRFRPQVAVGHDFNGEYGHVQHKVFAQLLADAVAVSADPTAYPDSAAKYGVWDVPKTYIHLYEENPIVMDWDQPMKNFDGMTPYEVARDLGFVCHGSQYESWRGFFSEDKAAKLTRYSPCYYGLYRTTVGQDEAKNDMFENVISYGEQERLAREEAERLAREEAERLAEEQKRQEEAEAAEQERIEEEQKREKSQKSTTTNRERMGELAKIAWIVGIVIVVIIVASAILNFFRNRLEYDEEESFQ